MSERTTQRRFLPFSQWPLRRKLMFIAMVTATSALLLAGSGIIASDIVLFYDYLSRDLNALSSIVADNTAAAVTFDDPESATETLGALRARPHLLAACVYREDKTLLARFVRPNVSLDCPPGDPTERTELTRRYVKVSRPIVLQRRVIGSLILIHDLGELWARMRLFGLTVLILLILAAGIALILSSGLSRIVLAPVRDLADVATTVSRTKDYRMRARKHAPDELGLLADSFNDMLHVIQERDNELTKALTDLQEANQRLGRSNEDLERFTFIASHDLQEPLRMITAYSQLLVRQYPQGLDGKGAMYVSNIVNGTSRMRTLLADLLTYTAITATSDAAEMEVDLAEVVRKSTVNLHISIEETGAVITADQLPKLRVAEAHMLAIFQNLLGNALKYRSNQPPCVHVTFTRIDDQLRFEVRDNGIGIDPKYHDKVFKAFTRLHAQHQISGTGIGLAICERVLERYGGRIWVESKIGEGATFFFTLPASLKVDDVAA